MMIAEVALDRYLKSYEPPLTIRERYPAKQDLGRLEPEALGWILGMVQYAVNGRYAGLGQAIRTPYGQVNVHLDFTETPKVERHVAENAVSFVRDGYAFLILSIPIVRRMFTICEEVGLTPAIWELLGLAPTDVKDKANLIAMLAVVQLQFVSNHELGHHFHGHCHTQDEVSSPVQEFDDGAPAGDEHPLRQQAMEVDADSYAVQLQVDQLLSGPMGDRAFAKLAPKGISKDVFLLNFLFVSIASYMFLKPQASIDPAVIKLRKHPPELMRMNVIMRVIKAFRAQN